VAFQTDREKNIRNKENTNKRGKKETRKKSVIEFNY
jgi:hypothetical protein